MKTKPFDIKKAKAGNPVCTRDLRPVRIVCYDRADGIRNNNIVALVTETDGSETAFYYNQDGTFVGGDNRHAADLQLAATEHTAWINIYKYPDESFVETGMVTYESEEEAKRHAMKDEEHAYIDTVKISWYE